MKYFIWFTKNSWSFLKGNRREFFTGFVTAWKSYKESVKRDKEL